MAGVEIYVLLPIAAVAFLYSSVGHAGASGYIAVLTLAGWAPAQIRPLALVLNILVSAVATYKFHRAGYFRPALFVPLAALAVPAAALGGYIELSSKYLSLIIGATLCLSALWLITGKREAQETTPPRPLIAMCSGGLIGFLAGLSGTGGGIFLSPLMIYMGWGKLKEVSALAAPFILLNSAAGLSGFSASGSALPGGCTVMVIAAVLGGTLGSTLGVRVLNPRVIQLLLAAVLAIAGVKLLMAAF